MKSPIIIDNHLEEILKYLREGRYNLLKIKMSHMTGSSALKLAVNEIEENSPQSALLKDQIFPRFSGDNSNVVVDQVREFFLANLNPTLAASIGAEHVVDDFMRNDRLYGDGSSKESVAVLYNSAAVRKSVDPVVSQPPTKVKTVKFQNLDDQKKKGGCEIL